jgi:hypothetical protein
MTQDSEIAHATMRLYGLPRATTEHRTRLRLAQRVRDGDSGFWRGGPSTNPDGTQPSLPSGFMMNASVPATRRACRRAWVSR